MTVASGSHGEKAGDGPEARRDTSPLPGVGNGSVCRHHLLHPRYHCAASLPEKVWTSPLPRSTYPTLDPTVVWTDQTFFILRLRCWGSRAEETCQSGLVMTGAGCQCHKKQPANAGMILGGGEWGSQWQTLAAVCTNDSETGAPSFLSMPLFAWVFLVSSLCTEQTSVPSKFRQESQRVLCTLVPHTLRHVIPPAFKEKLWDS